MAHLSIREGMFRQVADEEVQYVGGDTRNQQQIHPRQKSGLHVEAFSLIGRKELERDESVFDEGIDRFAIAANQKNRKSARLPQAPQ